MKFLKTILGNIREFSRRNKPVVYIIITGVVIISGALAYKNLVPEGVKIGTKQANSGNNVKEKEVQKSSKALSFDVVYVEDAYEKYTEQQALDGDDLDLTAYLNDEYSSKTANMLGIGAMPSKKLTSKENKIVLDSLKLYDDDVKREKYLDSNVQALTFDTRNVLEGEKVITEVNKSEDYIYKHFSNEQNVYTTPKKWYSVSDFKIGDIRVQPSKLSDAYFDSLKKEGYMDDKTREKVEIGYDGENTGVFVTYIVKADKDMSAKEFMKARDIKFSMDTHESINKPKNVTNSINYTADLDDIFNRGEYKNKDVLDSQLFYVTQFIPKADIKDINNSLKIGATEVKLKKRSDDEVFFLNSVYDKD